MNVQESRCDLAVEVLSATLDGDLLSPGDLKIVEIAVNDMLTPKGWTVFEALHKNATKPGGYTPPFFFGIEHMTREQSGHVLWRGVMVEHYDHDAYRQAGWTDRMKADAEKLAERCRMLEARGIQPTLQAVMDLV